MSKIIIASGPVIVEDNKVLLNKHGDDNFWKFCGGTVKDYNVGLEETAKREAKEEAGIDIEILNPEPFIMHINKDDVDVILVHFLAKKIGDPKPGEDIRELEWLDINNLPDDIGPNIKPALDYFLKNK